MTRDPPVGITHRSRRSSGSRCEGKDNAVALQHVLNEIDNTRGEAIQRLTEFLRIESISTDPAFGSECERAADWLVRELRSIGFAASKYPTAGHPMVMASGPSNGRRCLFYGHYDVQPVDPVELWDHAPFQPEIETRAGGDVIRARGACDDKGQLMTFVEACRAWKSVTGEVPTNIMFLFEGEEESGSPSLVPFLKERATELTAEIALICDTGLFDNDTPAVVTMLRGLLGEDVTVTGPNQDLHSGMFGGMAMNPARVLARILASLHDKENRITVPGFYDDVIEPPREVLNQWQRLKFDSNAFLGSVGLSKPAGETGRTPLEMIWSRPTCEVNGLSGGYSGAGFKTVLPSKAQAKVSFRLVAGQDPQKIQESFRACVRSMLPEDCSVSFANHGAAAACGFSTGHPLFAAVRSALSQEWPNEAVFAGCGGSIPIAGHFRDILGIDSILAGFGKEDDRIHSPNEKYDLRSFHLGTRTWARVISDIM